MEIVLVHLERVADLQRSENTVSFIIKKNGQPTVIDRQVAQRMLADVVDGTARPCAKLEAVRELFHQCEAKGIAYACRHHLMMGARPPLDGHATVELLKVLHNNLKTHAQSA